MHCWLFYANKSILVFQYNVFQYRKHGCFLMIFVDFMLSVFHLNVFKCGSNVSKQIVECFMQKNILLLQLNVFKCIWMFLKHLYFIKVLHCCIRMFFHLLNKIWYYIASHDYFNASFQLVFNTICMSIACDFIFSAN